MAANKYGSIKNPAMIKIITLFFLIGCPILISSCAGTAQKDQMYSRSLTLSQGMTKQHVLSVMGGVPSSRQVSGTQEVWIYSVKFFNSMQEYGYSHHILTFVGNKLAAIATDRTYGPTTYERGWIYEPRGNRPDAVIELRNR